ncbi:MAG: epoxyqueuosine reductase QueH [Lentisphaerae bacterium]|jgi:predicted adenine nucleotide alpha hydrolase (AANH) superfamily ATPase|nr:epoxyqueuosine reductase QueH [Lentisphaerota bacterium]
MDDVLLHTCCAPCASACIERLQAARYGVTLFFSNANIGDADEYVRRLRSVERLAAALRVELIVDTEARHGDWLAAIRGHEQAPEGGARCRPCFGFSLERTARAAARLGLAHFTTSLTVSPHKHTPAILAAGRAVDAARFLPLDFKKQGGFARSVALARQYSLYRQDYCGCEFSQRPAPVPHPPTPG